MNVKQAFRYLALLSAAALAIVFVAILPPTLVTRAQTDKQTIPASETFTSPLPTPEPLSREAQIALNYISTQYNLPVETLQIVNEHQRSYPLLGRTFKAFTVWTQDPDPFHIKIQP